jgi:hypothetical protein
VPPKRRQATAFETKRKSPEGTAESSPGRKSWVYIPTETSPAEPALSLSKGTTENAPGRKSWVNLDRTQLLKGDQQKPILQPPRTPVLVNDLLTRNSPNADAERFLNLRRTASRVTLGK